LWGRCVTMKSYKGNGVQIAVYHHMGQLLLLAERAVLGESFDVHSFSGRKMRPLSCTAIEVRF
jgi:hypothetical protein